MTTQKKMKERVKKLWLKELRSGKHKQTTGTLRKVSEKGQESFCCLGVLCDIYMKEKHKNPQWVPFGDGFTINKKSADAGTLPPCVQRWAGLDDENPPITERASTLAEFNDSGSSFKRIAEIIDAHL